MPFREIVAEEPTIVIEPQPVVKKPVQHTIPPQVKKSIFPKIIQPEIPRNPSVITGNPRRTTILDIPFPVPTPTPTAPVPPPAPIPDPIPEPIFREEPVSYEQRAVPTPPEFKQPQMIQISAEDYARLLQQHQQPVPQYVEPPVKRKLPSITLPKIDTSNSKKIGIAMVKFAVSVILIWFGLTSTGSYFGPASGRFGGQLAQVFYQYQIGSLVCMFGVVLIYDAITKLRSP